MTYDSSNDLWVEYDMARDKDGAWRGSEFPIDMKLDDAIIAFVQSIANAPLNGTCSGGGGRCIDFRIIGYDRQKLAARVQERFPWMTVTCPKPSNASTTGEVLE